MKKFAYIADFARPELNGECFKVKRMIDYGVPREFVFKDAFNKNTDPRPKWEKLLAAVNNGVVPKNAEFFIQDYRTFGRDLQQRKELIQLLLAKDIILRVLNFPFTLEAHDDPTTALIVNQAYADMYLRVHSMEEMRRRPNADESGNRSRGRRPKFIPQRFEVEYQKYRNRETSVNQISLDLEINRRTADKWVKIRHFYDTKTADFAAVTNLIDFENFYQKLSNQLINANIMSEKLAIEPEALQKLIGLRDEFTI